MLAYSMDMKYPVSHSSASTIYNTLGNQHIGKDESFHAFAKRVQLMYKTCTRTVILYDEGFLIRCFIKGLDFNFDQTRELLDCGVLPWYNLTLNEVLVHVTDIKLTKTSTGTWLTINASTNASGKQGEKCPSSPPIETTSDTLTMNPNVPQYLYKPSEHTFMEVCQLLVQYLCPICCRNTHPLHECNAVKNTYCVTLQSNNLLGQPQAPHPPPPPPATANQVLVSLPIKLIDESVCYAGYGSVPSPLSDNKDNVTPIETDTATITETLYTRKINESYTPYLTHYSNLKKCLGLAKQCSITLPHHACFKTSYSNHNAYPVLVDSGATHRIH